MLEAIKEMALKVVVLIYMKKGLFKVVRKTMAKSRMVGQQTKTNR